MFSTIANSHWIAGEGYKATKVGLPQTSNPYHNKEYRDLWNLGWIKYNQWYENEEIK